MPILPTRVQDLLDFFDQHGPLWQGEVAAIGLTVAQGTAVTLAATQARKAYNDQLAAIAAAKTATEKAQGTVRDSKQTFADAIRTIKAFAELQAKPALVYQAAQIPPPANPSPAPPPGMPTDLKASLETDGSVTLRWKAVNTAGGAIVWTVKRRTGSTGAWQFVGASGSRKFTDATIAAGSSAVQYVIYGQRGQSVGNACSPFVVQFGTGGPGLMITAQFSEDAAPTLKKAA